MLTLLAGALAAPATLVSPPRVVEEAQRLREVIAEPAEAAADRALASGDRRLWASQGLGYRVPGATYSNFERAAERACGVRMLPLLSDVMFPETMQMFEPGQRWAAAYNYRIVVQSRCLPEPPDARSLSFRAEVAELRRLLGTNAAEEAERAVAAGEKRLWRRHNETTPIGGMKAGGGGEPCELRPMPGLYPVFPVEVHDVGAKGETWDWPRDYNERAIQLTGCSLPVLGQRRQ